MSFWHRIKVRLGLEDEWDDEYYDDDYADDEVDGYEPAAASGRRDPGLQSPYGTHAAANSVRRVDRGMETDGARGAHLRSVPSQSVAQGGAPQVKMHIVEPKSFGEAQVIADKFKQGTPIILNLTAAPPDAAKRLLDFAAGLTYGLDGGLQKVSEKVFMLSPANVEVSEADRRRLQNTGLFQLPE